LEFKIGGNHKLKKGIIVTIFLFFLVGCTNREEKNSISNKQESKDKTNYIYIEENKTTITVNEAQNCLNQVLTDTIGHTPVYVAGVSSNDYLFYKDIPWAYAP
jgi:uncharacterized protein YcfL